MDAKDKAEKIAQAKKKLKEFQSKKVETVPAKPEPEIIETPQHSESPSTAAASLSTLESLYQLSTRINSIVKDENIPTNDSFVKDLEIRNQEVVASLDGERLKNEELSLRVRDLNSTVDKLKIDIERLKTENETKLTMEMGPLQEQLQSHIQTIGLLVGEKSELKTYLKEYQNSVEAKRTENLELETRLRASRFRVSELERELKTLKSSNVTHSTMPEVNSSIELELRKQNDEFTEQVNELKQKLVLKNDEMTKLRSEMELVTSQLSMASLRIEQLSSGDTLAADSRLESLTQQNLAKEMQITELKNMIQQLGTDRDQSNAQYQSYVLQLNREISNLGDKNLTLTEENDKLAKRETELMKHMGELEKQIQQQMTKQKDVEEKSQADSVSQTKVTELEVFITDLKEKLTKLETELNDSKGQLDTQSREKVQLKCRLDEVMDQLSSLELTNERLQTDKPDGGKLIAEIENYKVAASRAMTQNADLKNQLEEMQRVFVQLSNDKLELTEMLQSEQHLGREMRNTYSTVETDLEKTKEHLRLKDEEMIRLAHETTDLNKQILLKDQELDRLRHYEASSDAGNYLQRELESAKEYIEKQKLRIQELETGQGRVEVVDTPDESTSELSTIEEGRFAAENEELVHEVEALQTEKQELVAEIAALKVKVHQNTVQVSNNPESDTQIPEVQSTIFENGEKTVALPLQDALEKLQGRFRQTMNEVAELSEEKQQLEHLVTQLQFETETIGEYITLYQNQRRQLKQKDLERDIQLRKLAVDRENMRQKLLELNILIEQLLVEKKRKRNISEDEQSLTNGNASMNTSASDLNISSNVSNDETKENAISSTTSPVTPVSVKKAKTKATASKILELLSDIQTANQTSLDQTGVDHCSCCSGKLEVV